jgi:hypothetical protein
MNIGPRLDDDGNDYWLRNRFFLGVARRSGHDRCRIEKFQPADRLPEERDNDYLNFYEEKNREGYVSILTSRAIVREIY